MSAGRGADPGNDRGALAGHAGHTNHADRADRTGHAAHAGRGSAERAAAIARRLDLLEMEAELQRTALVAAFDGMQRRGALDLLTAVGGFAGRLFALPELRWLLLSVLWRGLSRRRP